jgi:hypothetical protein
LHELIEATQGQETTPLLSTGGLDLFFARGLRKNAARAKRQADVS